MKSYISIMIMISLMNIELNAQSPLEDLNWELNVSKSDEFNSTTLDSKWQTISGNHWGESYFNPSYVSLVSGELFLKIDKVGQTYNTGGIQTNNFNYLHGYFEVEAELPYGKGLWPCFWIWGADGFNSYTEFDILEPGGCQYQFADRNVCGFWYKPVENAPCAAYQTPGCDQKVEFDKNNITNMSTNYHKYAVEWHPGQAIFYLDDEPIGAAYNDSRVPFNSTRVVLDLQVDGGECGPNSSLVLPQFMKVNYFRYYSMKMDCNAQEFIIYNNFNFTSGQNLGVKKSYTIQQTTIPSGTNTTIRATDFILLGNGFEVPANTTFNAVTTPCY